MPIVSITTNVSEPQDCADILGEVSRRVSEALQKPEKWMSVSGKFNALMMFGGTTAPCAQVAVRSIGGISKENNVGTCKAIMAVLESRLGILPERVYVVFDDLASENVGWSNNTFAYL
eukprot:ANDGO_00517.mRNA.1 Macrophage migration inhibitory factor homolog